MQGWPSVPAQAQFPSEMAWVRAPSPWLPSDAPPRLLAGVTYWRDRIGKTLFPGECGWAWNHRANRASRPHAGPGLPSDWGLGVVLFASTAAHTAFSHRGQKAQDLQSGKQGCPLQGPRFLLEGLALQAPPPPGSCSGLSRVRT